MQPAGRRDVVDITMHGEGLRDTEAVSRSKVLARLRLNDSIFRNLTRAAALVVLLLLSGVIVSLIIGAAPALQEFGLGFLTSQSWNPVTEKFGALAPIYGTVVTSLIAMLIAVSSRNSFKIIIMSCHPVLQANSVARLTSQFSTQTSGLGTHCDLFASQVLEHCVSLCQLCID